MDLQTIYTNDNLPENIEVVFLDGVPTSVEVIGDDNRIYVVMVRGGELTIALDLDTGGEDSDGGTPLEPEGEGQVVEMPKKAKAG